MEPESSQPSCAEEEAGIFRPPPLDDAKQDIRLFLILAGNDSDPIALRHGTWQLKKAPPFRAISYSWGDPNPTWTILIDDKPCYIRENCHYALWQTRMHYPGSHVFVDALSINQQDLQEKSAQVQMMGSIYASAQQVLACVGPHGDDSEVIAQFDPLQVDEWTERAGKNTHAIYQEIVARGTEYCKRFVHAYRAFCHRPYWKRLWIVQELAMARDKQVLCGSLILSWHAIDVIMYCKAELPGSYGGDSDDDVEDMWYEDPLWNVGHWAKAKGDKFANILLTFGGQRCEDPRDRIYGLANLIHWSESLEPMVADYTVSSFDLAIQATEHLEVDYYLHLLSALRIDVRHLEMQELLEARRLTAAAPVPHSSGRRHLSEWTSFGEKTFTILEDQLGQLSCPVNLSTDDEPGDNNDLDLYRRLQTESNLKHFQDYKSRELVVGGTVIGLVCHLARAGDILMSYYFERQDLCLVLRPHADGSLEIIGQALLLNGHSIRGRYVDGNEANRYEYRGTLIVNLTVEDILVLLGQDLLADESLFSQNVLEPPTINAHQWVLRPLTRVYNGAVSSSPQAWLHNIRRYDTKVSPRNEFTSIECLDMLKA